MDNNTLEIVIVAGGMPFGPQTLSHKSLGGSETAVIGVATELRKRGHIVTVFCPLPHPGSPDYHPSGAQCELGVRYVDINAYHQFIQATEVDLLVVSRSPELFQAQHQAKKAVLWCHDLATYYGPASKVHSMAWNFDEIWCVSEWHRQQYHKVSGYPLERIRATRNGIMKYDVPDWLERVPGQLVYAARPERGLEALVRPGGVMSRLPEYNLKVTMYDNFPQHMQGYYNQLFAWAEALPNVEILRPHKQDELRALIAQSEAYIYPTDFEETSCMLARECIEQRTPMVTTNRGALPETLGKAGLFVVDDHIKYGTDEWCATFADGFRILLNGNRIDQISAMLGRKDLYWDEVAEQWETWAQPNVPTLFSQVWSLVEDSDIIPAIALLDAQEELTPALAKIKSQLEALYPYLYGRETLASYYERYFVREDSKGARRRNSQVGSPRFEAIAEEVSLLAPGAKVLDYGCAEGVIILDLADRFKDKVFHGVDHAATNIELCRTYAAEMGLTNVTFSVAENPDEAPFESYDGVICSEVLEHVEKPWELIGDLEKHAVEGARIIITVPQGPWEAIGLYDKEQWQWRAHIWHINKWMIRQMFADKKECRMASLFNGHQSDGRMLGHLVFSYVADHLKVHPVNPLEKAVRGRFRQTVAACIIAKDESPNILRMLNSLGNQVQQVHVALAEGTKDNTAEIIANWANDRPWMDVMISTIPDIEPGKFGFDDARNISTQYIETDWYLWIDCDEYLSGDFRRYTRDNALDSLSIHQHHFTCDPRGTPTMLDKPARLIRTNRGFQFYGKVHEHAEKGFNGGPGYTQLLGDVDIGHPGYVNEAVRRVRFNRNFPLLEWDHQISPDRKLGKFLWLRDIIHRMRYMMEIQNVNAARLLAEDAVAYYDANWGDWSMEGMGGMNALQYRSEALGLLGRGLPYTIQVALGDNQTAIQGIAESEEELASMLKNASKQIFEQRNSRYWQ